MIRIIRTQRMMIKLKMIQMIRTQRIMIVRKTLRSKYWDFFFTCPIDLHFIFIPFFYIENIMLISLIWIIYQNKLNLHSAQLTPRKLSFPSQIYQQVYLLLWINKLNIIWKISVLNKYENQLIFTKQTILTKKNIHIKSLIICKYCWYYAVHQEIFLGIKLRKFTKPS